jgi:hypothetical protein
MFVTLCGTREDVWQKYSDLRWFVVGLAICFVIWDKISNTFCESQTQIEV